jgi:hypothetical protein
LHVSTAVEPATQTCQLIAGDEKSVKACDENIKKTLQLTHDMIKLADKGDADREDTGCGILYGIMRDAAYKLMKLAQTEKENHIKKGWWHEDCS